jgi:hypothetical protein
MHPIRKRRRGTTRAAPKPDEFKEQKRKNRLKSSQQLRINTRRQCGQGSWPGRGIYYPQVCGARAGLMKMGIRLDSVRTYKWLTPENRVIDIYEEMWPGNEIRKLPTRTFATIFFPPFLAK